MTQDLITFIGRFHPVWVHLPIGFLVMAALFKIYVVLWSRQHLREAVSFSLLLGAISAFIASIFGFLLSQSGGYEGNILEIHRTAGWITVSLALLAWWVNKNEHRFSKLFNYSVMAFLLLTLFVTGHFGGSLTHGEDYLTAFAPFRGEKEDDIGRILYQVEDAEVFNDLIQPIFKNKCQSCHRSGKAKGELNLASYDALLKGGENGPVIIPGDVENSELIRRVSLPANHQDFMPAEGKKPLTKEEIQIIVWWIDKGKVDPKISLAEAGDDMVNWAKSRLNLRGMEQVESFSIDLAQINDLQNMGFRIRLLSYETGALDVVFPNESVNGNISELIQLLFPIKDRIYWLTLAETGIQDPDLSVIAQFSNLQRLRIENNPISDLGISALKNLSKLEVLNLNGTQVSGRGMGQIAEIRSLKSLYLWNTAVSTQDEWVIKMKADNVKVVIGA
ncbi:MAG: DUF2231 domain-containing protein [Cecembia sp.]